ncbi:MAG: class I SAM-dependent methyltransferase, partial [Algoriphagus sp.]
MKDHYSLLAPYYNRLSNLAFGDQLMWSKTCFLENLGAKKTLIIGGGAGLDYLPFQKNLTGEYWEISYAMLSQAKRNLSESKLTFHLGLFQAEKGEIFDEVWLPFVLDTMRDEEIISLLREIRQSVKPEARIYLADFFEPKQKYQRLLTWGMIAVFKLLTQHKRANIPDYEEILRSENWTKTSEKEFMNGWV